MRTLLALIVFALAIWRAVLDWMGSVALGEAYQFVSVGEVWGSYFPKGPGILETLIVGYLGVEIWRYVSYILVLPMISLLCFIGAFIWMIRRPRGVERRNVFKR